VAGGADDAQGHMAAKDKLKIRPQKEKKENLALLARSPWHAHL
jgi:hypothetical protein